MADDVDDNDMTNSRLSWKAEIDEWLEQLKTTEKDLGLKEKELRRREMILRQREKKLEEQFHVVVSILCIFHHCFTAAYRETRTAPVYKLKRCNYQHWQ